MTGVESGFAARVYTSDPANYPVSGVKKIIPNRWTKQVILGCAPFVTNSVEGVADVFPDHQFIADLGLGSVVNLPVVMGGIFIGTVIVLHDPGYYALPLVGRLNGLTLPALLSFAVSPKRRGQRVRGD